jgi:aryl-alcohol dehydrogenase-like predicted oxidoreductase
MTNLSSFEENSEADKEIINRVEEISKCATSCFEMVAADREARKRGVSMAQVAFAWSATKVDAPIGSSA